MLVGEGTPTRAEATNIKNENTARRHRGFRLIYCCVQVISATLQKYPPLLVLCCPPLLVLCDGKCAGHQQTCSAFVGVVRWPEGWFTNKRYDLVNELNERMTR